MKPLILTFFTLSAFLSASIAQESEKLFTLKILPLLSEKCFGCHDPSQEVKGGFDMTSRDALLKGGKEFSDTLVPGSAEKSFIMAAVKWADPDFEMPPKENDRLSEKQIKYLADWIDAGAPWPNKGLFRDFRGNYLTERDLTLRRKT
ncbi:MAG: hypothetical protein ACI8UO_006813 [Verrucomicrobiales bacterium]|jgi:hypothetical protein